MFWKRKKNNPQNYLLVEAYRPLSAEILADYRKAVPGLAQHAGFLYLLDRLNLQRDRLLAQLKYVDHGDMKQVYRLQAGIFWAEWLEKQCKAEVKAQASLKLKATSAEEEMLRQIDTVEFIGAEKEHNS